MKCLSTAVLPRRKNLRRKNRNENLNLKKLEKQPFNSFCSKSFNALSWLNSLLLIKIKSFFFFSKMFQQAVPPRRWKKVDLRIKNNVTNLKMVLY